MTWMRCACGCRGTSRVSRRAVSATCGGLPTAPSASCGASDAPPETLFGSIGAVPGIAKPWDDERLLVEALVDCGRPDRDVGMDRTHVLDALRGADQAYQPDIYGSSLLEPVDRGHRRIGGGQDGNDDDHETLGKIRGRLEVILDRSQCLGLAVKPDMR